MNLFSATTVVQLELNYYLKKHLNQYGIPLDNRATFTKLDWEFWVGALGTDS